MQFVQFASTKRGVLAVIFFHFSKLYKEYSGETKSKIDIPFFEVVQGIFS